MVRDTPKLTHGFIEVGAACLLFFCLKTGGKRKRSFFHPKVRRSQNWLICVFAFFLGACYYDANQSMYVFGGCTQSSCNAAFNDLWRLDLNSKEWIRPLASGERWQMFNSPTALSKLTLSLGLAGLILYFPACFIIIWLVFRLYLFFFFLLQTVCILVPVAPHWVVSLWSSCSVLVHAMQDE